MPGFPSRIGSFALALATAFSATACPTAPKGPARTKVRPASPAPRVDAFTEASPITAIAAEGEYLWTGSPKGLERWTLESAERLHIGRAEGLPGDRIDAIASGGNRLWVMTDGGAASLEDGAWTLAPPAPAPLQSGAARAAAADEDGVWLGSSAGLFRLQPDGWSPTQVRDPVTHLHELSDGALWIGTAGRGILRLLPGIAQPGRYVHSDGNEILSVRGFATAATGELFAVGTGKEGDRVAIFADDHWSSFRPSPALELRGVARLGDDIVLIGETRAFAVSAAATAVPNKAAKALRRDGMQLVPTRPGSAMIGRRFSVRPLELRLPAQVRTISSADGALLLGTDSTGTTRVAPDGVARAFRARELLDGALGLFVACESADDCFVATGGRTLWHFDGRTFAPQSIDLNAPDARVLAVVRSPEKRVLAIYQASDERTLHISERRHDHWESLNELTVETPAGRALLSFAHFAPDGLLWMGLSYRVREGEDPVPYGVAIIDLTLNAIAYHHQTASGKRAPGVLPIPNDVADVAFLADDEIWLATGAGATVMRGNKVRVYTESDGLESEILHGIAATEGGMVFVASRGGVGRFDGEQWSFPSVLRVRARAMARGSDGRLWMGTDRGVVAYDGQRTELVNRRRGLIDDDVENIAVDGYGRVWARTATALHILTPQKR